MTWKAKKRSTSMFFKVSAILRSVVTLVAEKSDTVEIVRITGQLDEEAAMLNMQLECEIKGVEVGNEEILFVPSDETSTSESLHLPAVLALELRGKLKARSLGADKGVIFELNIPYSDHMPKLNAKAA